MRFTQKTNSQTDGGQKCFFPAALKRITGCAVFSSFNQNLPKTFCFLLNLIWTTTPVTDEHCLKYRCSFSLHPSTTRGDAVRPSVSLVFLLVQKGCFSCRPRGAAPLMHKLMSEKCLYERVQCLESYLMTQHKNSQQRSKVKVPPKTAQTQVLMFLQNLTDNETAVVGIQSLTSLPEVPIKVKGLNDQNHRNSDLFNN